MTKCPDCAELNKFENLFCKHCGRCLLAPDPEKIYWATAMPPEGYKVPEGIDFYQSQTAENSSIARLKSSNHSPPVIGGWLLILNVLVVLSVAEILMYIFK